LLWKIWLCYLDDIVIYARTPQELLERLGIVLDRIRDVGLKVKPSKCELFKTEIKLLGHMVSAERVFSQGGIILRPHRARMRDRLLSQLMFLKCNRPRDWFDCVTDWWLSDCIYFADSVVCNCIFINSWCSGSDVHSKVLARRLVLVLVLVRPGTCYNNGILCRTL